MPDTIETRNIILSRLPEAELQNILRDAQTVLYDYKEVIVKANVEIEAVDFPETGMISYLQETFAGNMTEIVSIGNEGMIGSSLLSGAQTISQTAVCQVEGRGIRLPKHIFLKHLQSSPTFAAICKDYANSMFDRVAQSIVCRRTHSSEQRCASWMLTCQHRCGSNEFRATQNSLAELLGCSRQLVNEAAGGFQKAGLIKYSRGKVTILEPEGLRNLSCRCHPQISQATSEFEPQAYLSH